MIFKNPGESVGCDISVEHEGDATNPWFGFVLADHQATGFGGVRLIVGSARYVPAHEEWTEVRERLVGVLPSGIAVGLYDALVGLWETMPTVVEPTLGVIIVTTVRNTYRVLGVPGAGQAVWGGNVVDYVTGEPVPNVRLILGRLIGVGPDVTVLESMRTDDQGAFLSREHRADQYYYRISKTLYEGLDGMKSLAAGNNLETIKIVRTVAPTVEEWRRLRLVPGARVR